MISDRHDQPLEIAAHADEALRTVRIVLAVLSIILLAAYRPLTGSPSWDWLTLMLTSIVATVASLNAISRRRPDNRTWLAIILSLDVFATVALAVALDDPLGQQSWVLLVVPIVSAAVRSGGLASVLAWVAGSAGYLGAAATGATATSANGILVMRVPATLLAVAITIGVLARWMREGWEIQNEITTVVAAREQRLSVLERTRHALTITDPEDALPLCADQAIALGFSAVTLHHLGHERPVQLIGRREIVAETDPSEHDPREGLLVTVWTDGEEVRSHSVVIHEPRTNSLITGWSQGPIGNDQAQSLATLVSITSAAIETSTLLRQLRHAADHDPLTGLLNRGGLDRKLDQLSQIPGKLTIAFIDLDDFKSINDTHGHDLGDRALMAMARLFKVVVGARGLVGRYGGDEFVAVFPGMGTEDAQRLAQAALRATAEPVDLGSAHLDLKLSIGIATAQTPVAPSSLLHVADRALYQAKSSGKATYVALDLTGGESGVVGQRRPDQSLAPVAG